MKRIVLAASLVLACAQPALAHDWWPCGIEPPPASYAHREPPIPTETLEVPFRELRGACHGLIASAETGGTLWGCSLHATWINIVVIPKVEPEWGITRACVNASFEHEKYGHGNGLVHGPDGRGWFKPDGSIAE